ncbi:MAG: peptide ABC transporter substrate-binding protein, partial [Treponema sp.]|nr:peptide ABC transporter substrate-binding protein [Treponema sp.]
DNTTLVVHLKEPTEHLPSLLCHHSFCATSSKPDVYSGPFKLKYFKNGVLKMIKNPYYHDATSVVIPGITIVQTDDAEENTHLYNIGVVDWLLADVDANKILNSESVHVNANFGTTYLFFKNRGGIWDNTEMRQALLEAIPYSKLRSMFSIQASTLVYPLSGYPVVAGLQDYDEEDAKLMMQDARKNAGIPENKTLDIIFGIYDSPVMRYWAQVLKEAWKPLGVNLITQTASIEEYNPSIPYWNADLFTYSWIGDYADPLAFLELFRGKSTLNVANYVNDDYDALLSEAAQTTSASDRYKLLSKAEQLLLDDSMVIPISHSVSLNVINLYNIGGWQSNALDIHPYKYLYITRNRRRVPTSI